MGLFDKKYCDICGAKIGMLGNKKLADGNMCKDCAAKLSPHFTERRESTIAEIQEQLAYRERNKLAVAAFHATRTFGDGATRLQIDDDARKFTVSTGRELLSGNPDILSLDDITAAELKINERTSEIQHRDADGKMVPDDPPRTRYSYDFRVKIQVNHPYFDALSVQLNSSTLSIEEPEASRAPLTPLTPAIRLLNKVAETIKPFDPHEDSEYQRLVALGTAACEALNGTAAVSTEEEAEEPAEEAHATPNFCPNCGHKLEGEAKFCPNCGSKL